MEFFNEINIADRIQSYSDGLLDMSLNNKLLNFKASKKSIEVYDENIAELYQILVLNEKKMSFLAKAEIDESSEENDDNLDSEKPSYLDNKLQTKMDEDKLRSTLTSLYHDSKLSLEEQGYNSFFIALGFLEWTVVDSQKVPYKAPLILIPLDITRSSISGPFKVSWNMEEIRCNLSLQYKLLEQNIELPIFDDLESKDAVSTYLKDVRAAIKSKKNWSVVNDICLSNFSFKKFVMYKDLSLGGWTDINSNPIRSLFIADDDTQVDESEYKDNYRSNELFNVVDADSSQLAVIEEVKKGHNLVVEGPPGTGKSQTIVNIIAELMATGKTILFVSEKKAALDVVKSRLDAVGLGDGCLELHGRNSNKRDFLNEIDRTLSLNTIQLKDETDYQRLDLIKADLNDYSNTLFAEYGNTGVNAYDLIGMITSLDEDIPAKNQEIITFYMPNTNKLSQSERDEIVRNLEEIRDVYKLISPLRENPWRNTNPLNITSAEVRSLNSEFTHIITSIDKISKNNELIYELSGINRDVKTKNLMDKLSLLSSNTKLIRRGDDLDSLVDNIKEFQSEMNGVNLSILDLNVTDIKSSLLTIGNVISNSIFDETILDNEYFEDYVLKLDNVKEELDKYPFKEALNDPYLPDKLDIFKSNKGSFFKRSFSSDYKNIRREFRSYYDFEVDDNRIINDLTNLIKLNDTYLSLKDNILLSAKSTVSDDMLLSQSKKMIPLIDDFKKIKSRLASYANEFNYLSLEDIYHKILKLSDIKELKDSIVKQDDIGKYYFKSWNSYESDVDSLEEQLNKLKEFKHQYNKGLFTDKTIECINNERIHDLASLIEENDNIKTKILTTYNSIYDKLNFKTKNTDNLEKLKEQINNLSKDMETLNNYRLFKQYTKEYSNQYTKEIIKQIENDNIKADAIIDLFYYNFANNAINDIFKTNPTLDKFNYNVHETKINEFKELDLKVIKMNRIRIQEILSRRRPNTFSQISRASTLGLLQREITKKSRIMPIRKILSKTSDVIADIKPCFMMSPMSIAQYLEPKTYQGFFDYIIFDEASQVKVEDALGALLRGKHYVIMGDTKQLPPTSFFEVALEKELDEDDAYDITGIESILHLCKTTFYTKMLKWHYRSRHESLINVSNHEFYDNNLYLFPSPMKESEELGLKFGYDPTSVYQRGKGSKNIKEAENVVEYAFDVFRKHGNSKSLGIATFSMSQRKAIMNVLEEKLKENPELEKYFNETGEEGFFIKNLENIQGDERDIILISVGYGFDENHKLSLSFGPLNNDGGERRLNVLITRSKERCVVFSNFKSSDMHTEHVNSKGVEALKTFLYYAEHGVLPVDYTNQLDEDSPFEESVYEFLVNEGISVEKQVGCAGYKIDLAIVDPDDSDRYILAIECDGETYHSSNSARDRDRLRQQVLEALGWKFHRIWATDWFQSGPMARQRLLDAVNEAILTKDSDEIEEIPQEDYEVEVIEKTQEEIQEEEISNFVEDYETYDNIEVEETAIPETLTELMEQIITKESPIHIEDVYDRAKEHLNESRKTKKFKDKIDAELEVLYSTDKIYRKGDFLYSTYFDESNLKIRNRISPKIDRIPDEELIQTVVTTLLQQYSLPRDELVKIAPKLLGFKSVRANVKEKYNNLIPIMIQAQIIKEEGGELELIKEDE